MFAARTCARNASVTRQIGGLIGAGPPQRPNSTVAAARRETLLRAETPVAEQLKATNIWYYGMKHPKPKKAKGDKHRVNVVDEKLCDDIIDYIRPSLDRHRGCDIIDLFPGAGVWSRKLHDTLQPRSHLLLEPDESLYAPFLEPLTSRPGVTLLPKSGIVWTELNEVLNKKYLPHQVERNPRVETPQRNDTLLVTANISFFPKKKYRTFSNVTQLLLFQFINSIRPGTLFQKYGLVRMLLWVGEEEKAAVLPRTVQRRRRLSLDAEVSTEYIAELAGADMPDRFCRDRAIDLESGRETLARMEAAGKTIPPGRETALVRELQSMSDEDRAAIRAGAQPATFGRAYRSELAELEAEFEAKGQKEFSSMERQKYKRLLDLRYKVNWELRRHDIVYSIMSDPTLTKAELTERINRLDKYLRIDYHLQRDNLSVWRREPKPVMAWDRRPVEPLLTRDAEFFPNVPCALLDVQPKAAHPLLLELGPGTSRAGDTFSAIASGLMRTSIVPLGDALEAIYPGARDGVLANCPTLREGAWLPPGYPEWNTRSLAEEQFVEIVDKWMEWPFRPSFSELVSRESEDSDMTGDDEPQAVTMGDI